MSHKPAVNSTNEKLALAFDDLAHYEFEHGGLNTPVGASYSKIARAIRDATDEITSGEDAMQYRDIGPKTAAMIDEYFARGEIAKPPTKDATSLGGSPRGGKVGHHRRRSKSRSDSDDDESKRHKERIGEKAKNAMNQGMANAFEDLAEFEFNRGHISAGASCSKVARSIRDANAEITSGLDAMEHVRGIGKKSAVMIDEYLKTGRIAPSDTAKYVVEGSGT
ncbi:hypothetical protein DYB32_005406 [Aphanomyces invadans]|uniref:Crossover junction endonuclease MUS81-like HHH domain-containing protein n=1 Tax=Aphanomyces invadans TaxID=157072 RepID=A0A3R6Y800_9STRA|nr:hypothetical protein DYB32_005406 [Aphanomyces invadans]